MTDNQEADLKPRPWANAILSAILTDSAGEKTYLYILSDLEGGKSDMVLSASHPDLSISLMNEPPLFQYEVGLGITAAVCVDMICRWEQVTQGVTVETF